MVVGGQASYSFGAYSGSILDTLGILTFNTGAQWVLTPQPLGNLGFDRIKARIGSLRAEGGTDIYKALDAAFLGLAARGRRRTPAGRRCPRASGEFARRQLAR
jgi:hypothetical protein